MPAAEETGDFIIPAVSNGHRVSGTHGWYHSRSKHLIQYIQSEACQPISVCASTIWSLLQCALIFQIKTINNCIFAHAAGM